VPHRLPQDRNEAALVYFGLVRAYWCLAEAARDGRGGEDKREEIETDTIDALADAATACGTVSEETVANAVDTLKSIFDEAASKLH
jgi:hypothetical protein